MLSSKASVFWTVCSWLLDYFFTTFQVIYDESFQESIFIERLACLKQVQKLLTSGAEVWRTI